MPGRCIIQCSVTKSKGREGRSDDARQAENFSEEGSAEGGLMKGTS